MSARSVMINAGHCRFVLPADHPNLGAALGVLATAVPVNEQAFSRAASGPALLIPSTEHSLSLEFIDSSRVVDGAEAIAAALEAERVAREAQYARWREEDAARKAAKEAQP